MANILIEQPTRDASVTDVAKDIDLDEVLAEMKADNREVDTTDFIRALIRRLNCTFEYARSLVYGLIELGRAVLTDRYTLRLA